jgi:hypothetical protein
VIRRRVPSLIPLNPKSARKTTRQPERKRTASGPAVAAGNPEALAGVIAVNASVAPTTEQPTSERETVALRVHVLPPDLKPERALALLARYCDLVEVGEHPPYPYVAALFAEAHALVQRHRAEHERDS